MPRPAPFLIALMLWSCAQIPPAEVPVPAHNRWQAVVLDIDGTLTPKVVSVSEARPGAAHALNAYAAKGYTIVYLTARNPLFQAGLPDWLEQEGFPPGHLHVAQTAAERTQADVFKARILNEYVQRGWRLAYAYGDSSTDFRAYAGAGIPQERVFALRRRGSQECQSGAYRLCLDGWSEHLTFIGRDVPGVR
jgi:phosphatidate phosphatase PAH1